MHGALAAGLEVTVSAKFWCEHLGLPFHPTTQDPLYSASRYGYGALLRHPRPYAIAYQLWNQGTNRVLHWGDPAYVARFAVSCLQGDADGFEVAAPLTNRGWGNEPGVWRVLADPGLDRWRWEAERYWFPQLLFGRLGYNPGTQSAVWQREFTSRFGAAAAAVEGACRAASQVLPLLTATGMSSASEWGFWPEMDWGGSLDVYSVIPPSDHGQFYGIRTWTPVPGWLGDRWSGTHRGFVEDALADAVEAKWTPLQVSRDLDRLAAEALAALATARQQVATPPGAEFRVMEAEVRVQASLAHYHAAKKRAATHLAFFRATGEAGRLAHVCRHAEAAAQAWETLVRATEGVYSEDLVFGRAREQVGTPERPVNAHAGHWKDRLPNVRADVAFARDLLAQHPGAGESHSRFPGESAPADPPGVSHVPVTHARAGLDLAVNARITSVQPLRQVLLRYRDMDQTRPWTVLPMTESAAGHWRAVIPGAHVTAACDLLYYLEARVCGGGTLWPDWQEQAPYLKVTVTREP